MVVTRITQYKIKLKKERVELDKLVQLVVKDYRPQFAEKEVRLETELTADSLFLEADPTRMTQIVGNLLNNAVKFTAKGDKVSVKATKDDSTQEVVITVQDTGMGIQPELLTDLFQPFMQVDCSLDRNLGGLGLGLAIVKGMVELHDGSVAVHSEGLGHGTKFTIRLPVAATEKQKQEIKTVGLSGSYHRILIIDDISDIAVTLCSLLSYLGHKVITALSGPEGIIKAKEFRPNVLLCDIGLPGMNGYEVARSFQSNNELKDVYLIALSGYAQPEDLERSRSAGFNLHLAKPVNWII